MDQTFQNYCIQEVSHTKWMPEISIQLSVGWWNSTSRVKTGFVPADIQVSTFSTLTQLLYFQARPDFE